MAKEKNNMVYKVIFEHQEKIYEIYAHQLTEGALMGFIELEGLIFTPGSDYLIDPGEEKVRKEFKGVTRTYVPMHSVLRIDEVKKENLVTLTTEGKAAAKVTQLPVQQKRQNTAPLKNDNRDGTDGAD
jgi:hypothetical protein